MLILGLSIAYHDSAAALACDGRIVAAIAQERLTRRKRDGMACGRKRTDISESIRYCLEAAGATLRDVEMVVWSHVQHPSAGALLAAIEAEGGLALPTDRMVALPHHFAHACTALYASPFEDAAVMVLDGGGGPVSGIAACAGPEGDLARTGSLRVVGAPGCAAIPVETESYYDAPGRALMPLAKIAGQANIATIGPQYSAATWKLFGSPLECGKTMGLAAFGEPHDQPLFLSSIGPDDGPAVFVAPQSRRRSDLEAGVEQWRARNGAGTLAECPEACAYAATLQRETERALVAQARWLKARTQRRSLCIGGGVALNCLANTRVLLEAGFDDVFVPPAPGDDGIALGCALFGAALAGDGVPRGPLPAYTGRDWSVPEPPDGLRAVTPGEPVLEFLASRLERGDVVAWFDGGSEFGPRALGARSFLADPRSAAMRQRLNLVTKRREPFRPFAPVVLPGDVDRYFAARAPSVYMSFAAPVRSEHRPALRAITHEDGTARYQVLDEQARPRLAMLIRLFARRTGFPVLLNTSFNQSDEPLVESPADAARCFLASGAEWLCLNGSLFAPRAGKDGEATAC